MTSLLDVFVTVKPDMDKFGPEVKKKLNAIDTKKEGSQVAGRFGVGFNGAFGGIVKHSAGLFVGAFAAIKGAQFLAGFINDARESAKVGRVSAQVIKSTGGVAHITAAQIGDLATSISNKTGADDEAIQSGENLLATFTNVRNETGKGNKIFDLATQATVDMASAMNNGVVDAAGLKTANIQLGRALNDPIKGITALSKAGVSFTAEQKKQIKSYVASGDTLKAQKIILAEVGKEFGGAAAAATDPLTKLHTILGNVSETVGGVFLPYVDKAATWLGENLPGAVATAGKFFNEKLLPPIQKVTSFVKDRFIPGIQGIYDLLVKHDFSKEFSKAFHVEEDSGIVSFLLGISEGITTAAGNAKKWAGEIIAGLTSGFKTGDWTSLGSALGDGLTAGIKGIGSAAGELLDGLGELVDKIDWSALGGKISKGLTDLLKSVDWKGLGDAVGDAISTIFQKASNLSDKVGKAFKDLMAQVDWKKIGRDSTDAIGKFIEGVDWVKLAKTLGMAAIKSLKFDVTVYNTVINSAAELVIGMAQEIGKAIGKWFGDAGSWLKQKGKDLIGGLTSGASDQASGIGTWLSDHVISPVVDAFKDAGTWLVQHGKDLITGLKDGIWEFAKGLDDWMIRAPVAQLLAPWYGAGRWLIQNGKDLISGLKNGIVSVAKSIGSWVTRNVIDPTVNAFSKAGTWLFQHGKSLIAGMKNGIVSIAHSIGAWLSTNVVTPTVGAFGKAGTWLFQHGKNLIAGFKNGVVAIASTIGRWAYDHVIVPVVTPFGKAGSWLISHGRSLISGLLTGIAQDMKGIDKWIKSNVVDPVVTAVKHFFGIKSPSKVFEGIGGHLVSGLMRGLSKTNGTAIAKKVFGDMPSALRGMVGKGLVSLSGLPQKALDALGFGQGLVLPPDLGPLTGSNRRVFYQGEAFDFSTYQKLAKAIKMVGSVNVTQGGYEHASSYSGTTHTGGGVFDIVGGNLNRELAALKEAGLIGWIRNPSQGNWPWHIHALDPSDTGRMSASARGQVADYYRGGNGLGGYKQGTPWVPDDQLAFLHKGEGVIPADVNKARIAASTPTGMVELGPKSIAALAQALANLSISIDGRNLDAALSGTAMGRGY